jgi:hypothetical protein
VRESMSERRTLELGVLIWRPFRLVAFRLIGDGGQSGELDGELADLLLGDLLGLRNRPEERSLIKISVDRYI